MNDKKFIELLNLYVDQEISIKEAAELEREIAGSPQRRQVYLQYCRIHRASVKLGEVYKLSGVPAGEKFLKANLAADEKLVRFPGAGVGRSFSWAWISGVGIAAAAACVALVVVRLDDGGGEQSLAISPSLVASNDAVPVQGGTPVVQPALSPAPFGVVDSQRQLVSLNMSEPALSRVAAPSMAWMDRVQVPSVRSVSAEDLVFRPKTVGAQEGTFYRGEGATENKVEMTAFQFQK